MDENKAKLKKGAHALRQGADRLRKESLRGLMGDDFRQEFPWDNAKKERNK